MRERQDILEKIFDLLLLGDSKVSNSEYYSSNFREPHITKKIEINFSSNQKRIMTETFTSSLPDINAIGSLFEEQLKLDSQPANRLVNRIRHIFLKLINSRGNHDTPKTAITEIPINDFQIINDIVDELIKSYNNKAFSVDEMSAVQSVVLCVFENCDIGEPPIVNSKFKNPKRVIEPTFWDESTNSKSE